MIAAKIKIARIMWIDPGTVCHRLPFWSVGKTGIRRRASPAITSNTITSVGIDGLASPSATASAKHATAPAKACVQNRPRYRPIP